MRNLLLLALLSAASFSFFPPQNPVALSENSSMQVMGFKWSKRRQLVERMAPIIAQPGALADSNAKRYERNTKANRTAGEKDPASYTVDARSAEMEKAVQEAGAPGPIDGFAYKVKVQNQSNKVVDIVVWEYQFIDPASSGSTTRRQFLCAVKIEPDKVKEIEGFSVAGPGNVVSVAGVADTAANPLQEKAVINRVEYVDGTIWRRKDWNFAEIKQSFTRAVETPWGKEMCRAL